MYYQGYWKNCLKNGKGEIYYKDNSIFYSGIFENDKHKKYF